MAYVSFQQAADEKLFENSQSVNSYPDFALALAIQGCLLHRQAQSATGQTQSDLWVQVIDKYQKALGINPNSPEVLNNWGEILHAQAQNAEGILAESLWKECEEKYKKALTIKPDYSGAWINWGHSLNIQARQTEGDISDRLLADTQQKWEHAEEISPGSSTYNLSCIAAMRGQITEARQWLEKCVENGTLPPRDEIEDDPDMDYLRNLPWFQEILQKAKMNSL